MPHSGHLWYHIIINTRGTWLPGDPRGFRNRNARVRSAGDYKHPPPPDEHVGLHHYQRQRSGTAVRIPSHLFHTVCHALVNKVRSQDHHLLAVSVDAIHAHLLVELPRDRAAVKRMVGRWKQAASHALRHALPGRVWADGCDPQVIRDREHQRRVYRYILDHRKRGAFTWCFRGGDAEG